jgi:hypothetical protein
MALEGVSQRGAILLTANPLGLIFSFSQI